MTGKRITPMPCPFCGKKPVVVPIRPYVEGDAWGAVECRNKRCPTYDDVKGYGVMVSDGSTIADDRGSDKYKLAAIRRWNKRSHGECGKSSHDPACNNS